MIVRLAVPSHWSVAVGGLLIGTFSLGILIWLLRDPIAVVAVLIVVFGAFLIGVGWMIWREDSGVAGSRSDLGAALLGGAVVAFVVAGLQLVADVQRQEIADRQDLQITVGLSRDLRGIDLSERDLSEFHLRGKDLREAYLIGTRFVGANLSAAQFGGADLTGADFTRANLEGATFNAADECAADARVDGAVFEDARLTSAKLADLRLSGLNLTGANLEYADLSGAFLRNADLSGAYLHKANFARADLHGADLRDAKFTWSEAETARGGKANPRNTSDPYLLFQDVYFDASTKWPEGFDSQRLKGKDGSGGGGACI